MVIRSWTLIILGSQQASIDPRGLRLSRAYDRVRSLHLEREKGLWPQNRNKDLSFGIGVAEAEPTIPPLLRLPRQGYSPTSRQHLLIRTRVREFPSLFHPSSFHWAAPR